MTLLQGLLLLALPATALAGEWRLVDLGDCPGPQVLGSAGETPDPELCTAGFAGKTALCFPNVCNPGCQYIDVATPACKGGAESARVYTCVHPAGP